jgi:hypothetical protein
VRSSRPLLLCVAIGLAAGHVSAERFGDATRASFDILDAGGEVCAQYPETVPNFAPCPGTVAPIGPQRLSAMRDAAARSGGAVLLVAQTQHPTGTCAVTVTRGIGSVPNDAKSAEQGVRDAFRNVSARVSLQPPERFTVNGHRALRLVADIESEPAGAHVVMVFTEAGDSWYQFSFVGAGADVETVDRIARESIETFRGVPAKPARQSTYRIGYLFGQAMIVILIAAVALAVYLQSRRAKAKRLAEQSRDGRGYHVR